MNKSKLITVFTIILNILFYPSKSQAQNVINLTCSAVHKKTFENNSGNIETLSNDNVIFDAEIFEIGRDLTILLKNSPMRSVTTKNGTTSVNYPKVEYLGSANVSDINSFRILKGYIEKTGPRKKDELIIQQEISINRISGVFKYTILGVAVQGEINESMVGVCEKLDPEKKRF